MRRARRCHATYNRWIKEGRGQGTGADYKPWLTVRDVPSIGERTQILGVKTRREHHLMSRWELYFLLMMEWSTRVVDIREQYPHLSFDTVDSARWSVERLLEESLAIARDLGYRHHEIPGSRNREGNLEPEVPTTDFVLTIRDPTGGDDLVVARTIKMAKDLTPRTLQKLEIERQYWRRRGVDWGVVTERHIPLALALNLDWLHQDLLPTAHVPVDPEILPRVARTLTNLVLDDTGPLAEATDRCDDRLRFAPGTSLAVARHLIATRQWQVNMYRRLEPCEPLELLSVTLQETHP